MRPCMQASNEVVTCEWDTIFMVGAWSAAAAAEPHAAVSAIIRLLRAAFSGVKYSWDRGIHLKCANTCSTCLMQIWASSCANSELAATWRRSAWTRLCHFWSPNRRGLGRGCRFTIRSTMQIQSRSTACSWSRHRWQHCCAALTQSCDADLHIASTCHLGISRTPGQLFIRHIDSISWSSVQRRLASSNERAGHRSSCVSTFW